MMTRSERMLAAIDRRAVDCVPHATYNIHPYAESGHRDDPSYRSILDQIGVTAGAMIKVSGGGGWVPGAAHIESRFEGRGDARIQYTTLHTPKGDLLKATLP